VYIASRAHVLNKSGSILTGRNSATMSPQLPYLQFLFVALLLLQKDITCCFLDIDLTYVPGNRSKISKGCNAGSSEEEGDEVFRPQEN